MKISEWFKSLPKKFKVLVLIICAVVLLDFSLVIGLAAGNKKSALRIKCSDGTGSSVLMALNSAAKKGRIAEIITIKEYLMTDTKRVYLIKREENNNEKRNYQPNHY